MSLTLLQHAISELSQNSNYILKITEFGHQGGGMVD